MTNGNYITGVNPVVLKWAREKAGYSIQDVAKAFKKDVSLIEGWETGDAILTYSQLEKLAYQLYKRPVALFFYPKPPKEEELKNSFRTMPDFELQNLSKDSLLAIREARAMVISLKELNDGKNESSKKIFKDFKLSPTTNSVIVATQIREYLQISLEKQTKYKKINDALRAWRDVIQEAGIYIFRRPMKQLDISGFCLSDREFPVIYLNSSTSYGRQIFTIFHELAHILLNTNGLTKRDDQYIDLLRGDAKGIEIFCNKFAADFLVPNDEFLQRVKKSGSLNDNVSGLAEIFNVSRQVILRRYLHNNIIDKSTYTELVNHWNVEYRNNKKNQKKKNTFYYQNQVSFLGTKYVNLVFNRHQRGLCTVEQVADYLNIRVKNIGKLESAIGGRN